MQTFICLNGMFHKTASPVLDSVNRSFLYGDGLFETLHANGTIPQYIDYHIERLISGMKMLKMNVPDYLTADYMTQQIQGVLTRNKCFMGARVRITVFRNAGGLYTPLTDDVSYLIEGAALETDRYILNRKGYTVDLYTDIKKSLNLISGLKSTSSLIFVLAGICKKTLGIDDCLILNEKGNICESVGSNVFIIRDKKVITPSLKEGCLPGVMRRVLVQVLKSESGFELMESIITEHDLLRADELFLTNAVNGIRWVLAYRQKRYFNLQTKTINDLLNKFTFVRS